MSDDTTTASALSPENTTPEARIARLEEQLAQVLAANTALQTHLNAVAPLGQALGVVRHDVGVLRNDSNDLRTDANTARQNINTMAEDLKVETNARTTDTSILIQRMNAVGERQRDVDTAQDETAKDLRTYIKNTAGVATANSAAILANAAAQAQVNEGVQALNNIQNKRLDATDGQYAAYQAVLEAQTALAKVNIPFVEPTSSFTVADAKNPTKYVDVYNEANKLGRNQTLQNISSTFTNSTTETVVEQRFVKIGTDRFGRDLVQCQNLHVPRTKDADGLVFIPKIHASQQFGLDQGDTLMLDANAFAQKQNIQFNQGKGDDRGQVILLVEEGKSLDIKQNGDKLTILLDGKTTELTGIKAREIQLVTGKDGTVAKNAMITAEQYMQSHNEVVTAKKTEWETAIAQAKGALSEKASGFVKASDDGDNKLSGAEQGKMHALAQNFTDDTKAAVVEAGKTAGIPNDQLILLNPTVLLKPVAPGAKLLAK